MHELGVVFRIIDDLQEVAEENQLSSIASVTIRLGEVSAVIPDYLTSAWNWARKRHEVVRDCELKIETIKAVTYCEACNKTYQTVKYGRICPYCDSERTYLLTGNEFTIKEIEVPE
ncbi:hydrogenase nickel incorporation protein HypA/HybF [Lachnospiraceae bacterium C10]|nr:hydrogenase nickel incorporation protein HypA/HybF [Lachnospiraceae bacterium C10]